MFKHVLVPLDGSNLAETAITYARQITQPGATITLITAVDVPEYSVATYYAAGVVTEPPRQSPSIENMIPHAREYLYSIGKLLEHDGWNIRVEAIVGDAASTIIEVAQNKNVDAIVISTHGRSGINRWLFGSVTQKVLAASTCPVLVVPNDKKAK